MVMMKRDGYGEYGWKEGKDKDGGGGRWVVKWKVMWKGYEGLGGKCYMGEDEENRE
jgi:hypothetical protein